jgi:hypothetical protein
VIDDARAGDVTVSVIVDIADVDNTDLRILEVLLEPVGGNDRRGSGRRREREDVKHRDLDVIARGGVRMGTVGVADGTHLPYPPYVSGPTYLMNSISR